MLRDRIITGIIAAAGMLVTVLWLPTPLLAVATVIFILIAAKEWATLTEYQGLQLGIFSVVVGMAAFLGWIFFTHGGTTFVLLTGLVWWLLVLVMLATYHPKTWTHTFGKYVLRVAAFLTLIPAWVALLALHQVRPQLLIFLFILVWVADSAAYFSGKQWGKTKLAPELSPGKTLEGLGGAIIATGLWAIMGIVWLELSQGLTVYFILLCLVTGLMSVAGDLFVSLLKRRANVKDSGSLFPGHGGVLDRIDSISAAAPVFALGYFWMNWSPGLQG